MYDAYMRMRGKNNPHILYLWDHDPSGLDMIRDVRDRLEVFGVYDLKVHHLAITKDQIDEFWPPPNPAKVDDPRAGWYIQEHWRTSWEVDALPPDYLVSILSNYIESMIDMDIYRRSLTKEKEGKMRLEEIQKNI